jgi:hypothetical protein
MSRKRKRDATVVRRGEEALEGSSTVDGHDIFRQYFESRFEPLPELRSTTTLEENTESELEVVDDSDWSGFSDDGRSSPKAQVIEYSEQAEAENGTSRSTEFKAFMVSQVTPLLRKHGSGSQLLMITTEFEAPTRSQSV